MTKAALPRLHDRLTIGDGVQISPFCLGMVQRSDSVLAAFDAGINFFFVSADLHWPMYDPLRRGIEQLLARGPGMRDRMVVAGVTYMIEPQLAKFPFEELVESIAGLGTLDVMIAGGMYGIDVERRLPHLRALRAEQQYGARAIGATFHDRRALVPIANEGTVDLCFVRFNAAHRGAITEVFPYVAARKAPIFNFKSSLGHVSDARCEELGFGDDYWRPSIADHYRYALSHEGLDGVLCALDHPDHVQLLADALEAGPLDQEECEHIEGLRELDVRK